MTKRRGSALLGYLALTLLLLLVGVTLIVVRAMQPVKQDVARADDLLCRLEADGRVVGKGCSIVKGEMGTFYEHKYEFPASIQAAPGEGTGGGYERDAAVAQAVEQTPRKRQVGGASPSRRAIEVPRQQQAAPTTARASGASGHDSGESASGTRGTTDAPIRPRPYHDFPQWPQVPPSTIARDGVSVRVFTAAPPMEDCAGQTGHSFAPCADFQRHAFERQAGDGAGPGGDAGTGGGATGGGGTGGGGGGAAGCR